MLKCMGSENEVRNVQTFFSAYEPTPTPHTLKQFKFQYSFYIMDQPTHIASIPLKKRKLNQQVNTSFNNEELVFILTSFNSYASSEKESLNGAETEKGITDMQCKPPMRLGLDKTRVVTPSNLSVSLRQLQTQPSEFKPNITDVPTTPRASRVQHISTQVRGVFPKFAEWESNPLEVSQFQKHKIVQNNIITPTSRNGLERRSTDGNDVWSDLYELSKQRIVVTTRFEVPKFELPTRKNVPNIIPMSSRRIDKVSSASDEDWTKHPFAARKSKGVFKQLLQHTESDLCHDTAVENSQLKAQEDSLMFGQPVWNHMDIATTPELEVPIPDWELTSAGECMTVTEGTSEMETNEKIGDLQFPPVQPNGAKPTAEMAAIAVKTENTTRAAVSTSVMDMLQGYESTSSHNSSMPKECAPTNADVKVSHVVSDIPRVSYVSDAPHLQIHAVAPVETQAVVGINQEQTSTHVPDLIHPSMSQQDKTNSKLQSTQTTCSVQDNECSAIANISPCAPKIEQCSHDTVMAVRSDDDDDGDTSILQQEEEEVKVSVKEGEVYVVKQEGSSDEVVEQDEEVVVTGEQGFASSPLLLPSTFDYMPSWRSMECHIGKDESISSIPARTSESSNRSNDEVEEAKPAVEEFECEKSVKAELTLKMNNDNDENDENDNDIVPIRLVPVQRPTVAPELCADTVSKTTEQSSPDQCVSSTNSSANSSVVVAVASQVGSDAEMLDNTVFETGTAVSEDSSTEENNVDCNNRNEAHICTDASLQPHSQQFSRRRNTNVQNNRGKHE